MKIISANVGHPNRKVGEIIRHTFSGNPDIVCFQELPEWDMAYLNSYDAYETFWTYDAVGMKNDSKLLTTCIKKDLEPENKTDFVYCEKDYGSILKNIFYRTITKKDEKDIATIIDTKKYRIFNFRLSTAIGPLTRVEMLKNILSKITKEKKSIICGDFNSTYNLIFNLLSGWLRNYKLKEYFYNEYKALETLFMQCNLVNPFSGMDTLKYPIIPSMQLDYILVEIDTIIKDTFLDNNTRGSDHKLLLLETD